MEHRNFPYMMQRGKSSTLTNSSGNEQILNKKNELEWAMSVWIAAMLHVEYNTSLGFWIFPAFKRLCMKFSPGSVRSAHYVNDIAQ